MLTIIVLPENFVASTTQSTGQIFSDLSPITTLIIGVLLGVVVVEVIIAAIRPH